MLGTFVSLVIIGVAFATVVFMFWAVLREKHEHLEYYIPPEPSEENTAQQAEQQAAAES